MMPDIAIANHFSVKAVKAAPAQSPTHTQRWLIQSVFPLRNPEGTVVRLSNPAGSIDECASDEQVETVSCQTAGVQAGHCDESLV